MVGACVKMSELSIDSKTANDRVGEGKPCNQKQARPVQPKPAPCFGTNEVRVLDDNCCSRLATTPSRTRTERDRLAWLS